MLSLSIGCQGAGSARAQAITRDFAGWFFDSRALSDVAPAIASSTKLEQRPVRLATWDLAQRYGPALAQRLQRRASGVAGLTLLAAAGLAGGPTARRILTQRLARRRGEPETVFACFAAARPRAGVENALLLKLAEDAKRSEVERLAARIALLAAPERVGRELWLRTQRDRGFDAFLRMLDDAVRRGGELSAPARIPTALPAAGSLGELELRARLLRAAARPTLAAARADLLAVLAAVPRVRALTSLALGRVTKSDQLLLYSEQSDLDRPMFLAGLDTAEPALQQVLVRGPSAARSEEWRRLWWAAAVRLLDEKPLATLLPALIAAGTEADAGVDALAKRLLNSAELRSGLGPALEKSIAGGGQHGRAGAIVVALMTASGQPIPASAAKLLGARACFALDLWREARLGRKPAEAARLLWRELHAPAWLRATPGSFDAAFTRELNRLVRDLFVAGGDAASGAYLPEGIRANKRAYFQVLGDLLDRYPLFRGE